MTTPNTNDPEFSEPPAKPSARSVAWVYWTIVGLAFLLLEIDLFLPAMSTVCRADRRTQCASNLRQIGLALHNYEVVYGQLPPAYTVDAQGRPLHSWRTLILPYTDELELYQQIDLAKPWNDPVNAPFAAKAPQIFRCPDANIPANQTTYAALVGPDAFLLPDRGRRLTEIADGPDSTVAVVERETSAAVPWMAPLDVTPDTFINLKQASPLSHPGGVNMLMADGRCHFIRITTNPDVLRALTTVAGKESIKADLW